MCLSNGIGVGGATGGGWEWVAGVDSPILGRGRQSKNVSFQYTALGPGELYAARGVNRSFGRLHMQSSVHVPPKGRVVWGCQGCCEGTGLKAHSSIWNMILYQHPWFPHWLWTRVGLSLEEAKVDVIDSMNEDRSLGHMMISYRESKQKKDETEYSIWKTIEKLR